MTEQTNKTGRRPIWYFVGLMLTMIGLLIFIAGVAGLFITLPSTSVVEETRPDLWWGGFITLIGMFYMWKYHGVRVE